MNLIVAKFGGTSMGSKEAMERSARIVLKNPQVKLVVVSATSGTTSVLVELAEAASQGMWERALELSEQVKLRHRNLCQEVGTSEETTKAVEQLLNEMHTKAQGMHLLGEASLRTKDVLYSLGERLSSLIFRDVVASLSPNSRVGLLDARDVIKTDDQFGKAEPQIKEIKEAAQKVLMPLLENSDLVVTQGYIGSDSQGTTTTLGRGGSDYSAALFGEALECQHVEIWTDVSGIATTDPRLVPKARSIPEISFAEAAELATFGAKVLHPATLWPAMRKYIPVFVGNSFDDAAGGTWVRRETQSAPLLRALALRDNQKLLTITSLHMLHAHGFLEKIFGVLARHKISVDLVTTSEVSVSLTIDRPTLLNAKVLEELGEFCEVKVEENLSLVALVGNDLAYRPGFMSEVFNVLSPYTVRLICFGASRHNLCFLVPAGESREVIKVIHAKFLENG